MEINKVSEAIIKAAIEVHRNLGPGLLESAYEECLCYELGLQSLHYKRQVPLPIVYKGINIECGYRIDVLVDDLIVIKVKAVEKLLPIHDAQLLTYLKLGGWHMGLILNFNTPLMKQGIKRLVLGLKE